LQIVNFEPNDQDFNLVSEGKSVIGYTNDYAFSNNVATALVVYQNMKDKRKFKKAVEAMFPIGSKDTKQSVQNVSNWESKVTIGGNWSHWKTLAVMQEGEELLDVSRYFFLFF
jgi:hypothetical protein